MHQFELVYNDVYAALRGLVSACGGSKSVGVALWPAKGVEKAASWLDDCLNTDRQAKLSLEEFIHLLLIGREKGFHAAKHYLDDATHYERSQPVEPETELTKLLREYLSREQNQDALKGRIDALVPKVRAVR
jgi:hypothetical protein